MKRPYEKPAVRELSRVDVWHRQARAAWTNLCFRAFFWLWARFR